MIFRTIPILLGLLSILALVSCDGADSKQADSDAHNEDEQQAPKNPNLIDIPSAIRSNLGISFVEVERRRVEKTLRVPGRFEYLPTAQREYRTPMPGRVELLVDQFQRVENGDLLYRIDSPGWRELQQQLAEATSQIDQLQAQLRTYEPLLEAHEVHEKSLRDTIKVWTARVEGLERLSEAGGGRVAELTQARASLSGTRADLAEVGEKKAQLLADQEQARAGVRAAKFRLHYLLDSAAAITSINRDDLTASVDQDGVTEPRWATINKILVRSDVAGVVSEMGLTNGAWADEKSPVLTVVQPDKLRFRASGLQSDLGALDDGLSARIVPPTPTATGRAIPISDSMTGKIMVGLEGDPNDRTIDLYVVPDALKSWARPGVSAQLEIVTDASAEPELSIPLAAVQRDGLTPYIFRRTPGNPDQVMRMEADLGKDDGRWVELLSGVADGDEIVLDGAFQLMLSTSGTIQKGGHFHADGTFHDGEH
ncbi:MAG: efflux RND transporter periplasmic adaptor subunit [Phycisphaeraceae bacterium]|nr:efflux RND transporter periplasmic adaptor subunit [Phycisphaeraceae bacterium]